MCYSSGATIVAVGYGQNELNGKACVWLAVVGAIMFSTLQMQDMADRETLHEADVLCRLSMARRLHDGLLLFLLQRGHLYVQPSGDAVS